MPKRKPAFEHARRFFPQSAPRASERQAVHQLAERPPQAFSCEPPAKVCLPGTQHCSELLIPQGGNAVELKNPSGQAQELFPLLVRQALWPRCRPQSQVRRRPCTNGAPESREAGLHSDAPAFYFQRARPFCLHPPGQPSAARPPSTPARRTKIYALSQSLRTPCQCLASSKVGLVAYPGAAAAEPLLAFSCLASASGTFPCARDDHSDEMLLGGLLLPPAQLLQASVQSFFRC